MRTPRDNARRVARVVGSVRARRGLSLVEVVVAMAILGLAAAVMVSSFSFVQGALRRQETRLAAAELANRLVLQFLDDPELIIKQAGRPISYGHDEYRWDVRRGDVRIENDPVLEQALANGARSGPNLEDRIERVTVTVWLSEVSGGSPRRGMGAPEATITRVLDPLNLVRNPDAAKTMNLEDPRQVQRIMEILNGQRATDSIGSGDGG